MVRVVSVLLCDALFNNSSREVEANSLTTLRPQNRCHFLAREFAFQLRAEPRTGVELARANALTPNAIATAVTRKLEPTTTARTRVQPHDQTHTHACKPVGKHTRSQHTRHTHSQTIINTWCEKALETQRTRKRAIANHNSKASAPSSSRRRLQMWTFVEQARNAFSHVRAYIMS